MEYLNEGSSTIVLSCGDKYVLKIPKAQKNERNFHKYIDELQDISIPIIDASWRHEDSCGFWILAEKIKLKMLNPEELISFVVEVVPIMLSRKVYFTDYSKKNITKYKNTSKIYDYDFTKSSDTYILFPFKDTPIRKDLFKQLTTNESKMIGISIVMCYYFLNKDIKYDSEFEIFIDKVCRNLNVRNITYETIVKISNSIKLLKYMNDEIEFPEDIFSNIKSPNEFTELFNPIAKEIE
jgi:hypothetical protein